jgi:hypothetical protein
MAAIVAAGLRPATYRGDKLITTVLKALLENVTDDPNLNTENTLKAMIPQHLLNLAA